MRASCWQIHCCQARLLSLVSCLHTNSRRVKQRLNAGFALHRCLWEAKVKGRTRGTSWPERLQPWEERRLLQSCGAALGRLAEV